MPAAVAMSIVRPSADDPRTVADTDGRDDLIVRPSVCVGRRTDGRSLCNLEVLYGV